MDFQNIFSLSTKEFIELIKELNCVEGNSQTVFDLVTTLAKVRSTLQQDRTRIPDHVLILTESTSFRLKHLIAGELLRLNTMGVNVVSVGLGDQVKEEAIKAISSPFFVVRLSKLFHTFFNTQSHLLLAYSTTFTQLRS